MNETQCPNPVPQGLGRGAQKGRHVRKGALGGPPSTLIPLPGPVEPHIEMAVGCCLGLRIEGFLGSGGLRPVGSLTETPSPGLPQPTA